MGLVVSKRIEKRTGIQGISEKVPREGRQEREQKE